MEKGQQRWIDSVIDTMNLWANSERQWRKGEPDVPWSMGCQRVGHDLAT